jgi:hypothetical protein
LGGIAKLARNVSHTPIPVSPRFSASRRTLLKAGVAGGAALLLVRRLHAEPAIEPNGVAIVSPAARAILAALIPVFLDGALPAGQDRLAASTQTLAGVEAAIAGLPSASRNELAELFSLLDFPPTRWLLAGVRSPWTEASSASVAEFLDRWRQSRFALLRSAYGALHQLVFAAWYAQPRAWPAIGYPGPPSLAAG